MAVYPQGHNLAFWSFIEISSSIQFACEPVAGYGMFAPCKIVTADLTKAYSSPPYVFILNLDNDSIDSRMAESLRFTVNHMWVTDTIRHLLLLMLYLSNSPQLSSPCPLSRANL